MTDEEASLRGWAAIDEPAYPMTMGYVTNDGEFLNRRQAFKRAVELNNYQPKRSDVLNRVGELESVSFERQQKLGTPEKLAEFTKASVENSAIQKAKSIQLLPKRGEEKATGWILPNKKFAPLETGIHEGDLNVRAAEYNKKFGTKFSEDTSTPDVEERQKALNAGFARVHLWQSDGTLVIEVNKDNWDRLKGTLLDHTLKFMKGVDKIRVNLVDNKGNLADNADTQVFRYSGKEKEDAIQNFFDSVVPTKGKVGVEPSAIQRARAFPDYEEFMNRPGNGQFMPAKEPTNSKRFKEWSENAPLVRADENYDFNTGKPVVVEAYHGTTRDFEIADPKKGYIGNLWGKAFYASNSVEDVNANYAGIGPDLKIHLEDRAQEIQNMDVQTLKDRYGISQKDAEALHGENSERLAQELAKKELTQHGGAVMKLFIRFKNPLVLGDKGEPYWEANFDEGSGEESGDLVDFINSIKKIAPKYDVSVEDLNSVLGELIDGGKAGDILNKTLVALDEAGAIDPDTGEYASPEVLRHAVEKMGYDGIVDRTVNKKFGLGSERFNPMRGVNHETVHYVAFSPYEVKSATGNKGTFDKDNPSIQMLPAKVGTKEFEEWRRDSKVKDIVYHGTPSKPFEEFQIPSKGFNSTFLGNYETKRHAAFFTPEKEEAATYAVQGDRKGSQPRKFYLNLTDPVDLTHGMSEALFNTLVDEGVNERWLRDHSSGKMWPLFDSETDPDASFVKALEKMGYDGAKFYETGIDSRKDFLTYAAFHPEQIRYIPENPDIQMLPAKTASQIDTENYERAERYFNIGHENRGSRPWMYDEANDRIRVGTKGTTHALNFGPGVADRGWKGWYDPGKENGEEQLSIAGPERDSVPPPELLTKLHDRFGDTAKVSQFLPRKSEQPLIRKGKGYAASEWWVGPEGIRYSKYGHEQTAVDYLKKIAPEFPWKHSGGLEQNEDIRYSNYHEMEKRGWIRATGTGDGIELDSSGAIHSWEDIPKKGREQLEDIAFGKNRPILFDGKVVFEKPRPEEPSFLPRQDKDLFGELSEKLPDNSGRIGLITSQMEVDSQPTKNAIAAEHRNFSGWKLSTPARNRWHYVKATNEVNWNIPPTREEMHAVDNHLTKFGIEDPQHVNLWSGLPVELDGEGEPSFLPRRQEQDLFGEPIIRPAREVRQMTPSQITSSFPEAIRPKLTETGNKEKIPYDFSSAPLVKGLKTDDEKVKAYSDRMVQDVNRVENTPMFKAGQTWYSEFVPKLKKWFGPNAGLFAELLAASSPRTNPKVNFGYAIKAFEGWQRGEYDHQIQKFNEGLEKLQDGSLATWYRRKIPEAERPENPGPQDYFAEWIAQNELLPKQWDRFNEEGDPNEVKFGMHGTRLMMVLARRWLDNNPGPKVSQFLGNLTGEDHGATIDVWAARTLRRLGYDVGGKRWRILPEMEGGVSDEDFKFGQRVFAATAERLGTQPDALQGGLWFAEKKYWADHGWGKLDYGDYRSELENLISLRKIESARGIKTHVPLEHIHKIGAPPPAGIETIQPAKQSKLQLDIQPAR
jgi:hypothetical protein